MSINTNLFFVIMYICTFMPWDESTNPKKYNKRRLRGRQMTERGIEPKQISQNSFEIPSQSKDLNHIVTSYVGSWRCTCPDFQFRHVTCKHIHAVVLWQKLSRKLTKASHASSVARPKLSSTAKPIIIRFTSASHARGNSCQIRDLKECATTRA